ncbi:hypothetical protein D3C80_438380 [compost metagenome]
MVTLNLLVQKASIDASSQNWGEFTFVSSPSPGDRIAAQHDGSIHYLTVLSVHHKPVALATSDEEKNSNLPSANVVAIWTGSDAS